MTIPPNVKYQDQFLKLEREAREKGRGLWLYSAPAEGPPATYSQPGYSTNEATVYITRTGAKYHRAGCRYLKKSCIPISLNEAKQRGYTPCSVCGPPQ